MSTDPIDHYAVLHQQRAIRHELLSRGAASYFCNPILSLAIHPCRMRKCHRDRVCSGPMRTSAVLLERLHALQRLGFASNACTVLPVCLAAADQDLVKAFESWREDWASSTAEWSHLTWKQLSKLLRCAMRSNGADPIADDKADDL